VTEGARVTHEDGTKIELAAGDAHVIEAGHDAWLVGEETFQGVEFESRLGKNRRRSALPMRDNGRGPAR